MARHALRTARRIEIRIAIRIALRIAIRVAIRVATVLLALARAVPAPSTGTSLEIGEAVCGGLALGSPEVCPCDTLGDLPLATVIICGGASRVPTSTCGTVTVAAPPYEFRRGDANRDGRVDIGDPVAAFVALFSAGLPLPCESAADVDGNGVAGIADVAALLAYLFSAGPPPAPPFPGCGIDPPADCDHPSCP